jgi:hypothetical protein
MASAHGHGEVCGGDGGSVRPPRRGESESEGERRLRGILEDLAA